jgi:hypothetical protein
MFLITRLQHFLPKVSLAITDYPPSLILRFVLNAPLEGPHAYKWLRMPCSRLENQLGSFFLIKVTQ